MSLDLDDTIVAIATPPGRGAIGVIRLSGSKAAAIAGAITGRTSPLEPRHALLSRIATAAASAQPPGALDQVLVTWFPAPHSYTGQDVVEISAHGSPAVLRSILQASVDHGARPGNPGEFTLRAYLNGRLDLAQAEAVADLVDAVTPLQARAACDQLQGTLSGAIEALVQGLDDLIVRGEASLDFPEEGYHFIDPGELAARLEALAGRVASLVEQGRRGRIVRDGFTVAIAGRPNTGKSSLFNRLVGSSRAIVTDQPGTTRDVLTETVDLRGLCVTLVDTAGRREAPDVAEAEGVRRAIDAAAVADVVLCVLDRSGVLAEDDQTLLTSVPSSQRLIVANKIDRPAAWDCLPVGEEWCQTSALTGEGIAELVDRVLERLDADRVEAEPPLVTNVRHVALLEQALAALRRAARAAAGDEPLPEEFVLADLHDARQALGGIVGHQGVEDLLAEIFSRFCIGK